MKIYYILSDVTRDRLSISTNEMAIAAFKLIAQQENCALYLEEDGQIILTWNGCQSEPFWSFVTPETPREEAWRRLGDLYDKEQIDKMTDEEVTFILTHHSNRDISTGKGIR